MENTLQLREMKQLLEDIDADCVTTRELKKQIKLIENRRVREHSVLSATSIQAENGLTMDSLMFSTVCMCRHRLQLMEPQSEISAGTNLAFFDAFYAPIKSHPVFMEAHEIDLTIACIFHWSRWILAGDKDLEGFRKIVISLEHRCACLVAEHILGTKTCDEFYQRRVAWGCAIAKFKHITIEYMAFKNRVTSAIESIMNDDDEQLHKGLLNWIVRVLPSWNGARLREAIARASKKTDLRPDESAKIFAFGGNANLERARGALDCTETTLHELDLNWLVSNKQENLPPTLLRIFEILVIKLLHNALEAEEQLSFDNYVILVNNRAQSKFLDPSSVYIQQTLLGWVLQPRSSAYQVDTPSFFTVAAARWYQAFYLDRHKDPLGLADINLE